VKETLSVGGFICLTMPSTYSNARKHTNTHSHIFIVKASPDLTSAFCSGESFGPVENNFIIRIAAY